MTTLTGNRDRRAHRVTFPSAGQRPALASRDELHVTVVGGGLAGVAAAMVLAERGASVTLHEAGPELGGRLSSWPDTINEAAGGRAFDMERGFHAFFRQYYNLRNLLRRIDPNLGFLRPCDDYPLFGPNGAMESFAGLPTRPPLNLAALIKRTPTLNLAGLRQINGDAAAEMLAFDGDETYARFDAMSASAYLDSVNFPSQARLMLFEVFAHSFFNPQEEMSAAEMLMMFHLYFCGSAEGILFDIADAPFRHAIWDPLRELLEQRGVDVRTGSPVGTIAEPSDGEAVVMGVTVEALQSIVASNAWMRDGADMDRWASDVASLRQAPPFAVLRLWLDRPLGPTRAKFAGTAGMGIIDNISAVGRYQGEARAWEQATGGSVVELHGYALGKEHADDSTRTRTELLAWLHELYPETRDAVIVDERLIVARDCPSFEPGSYARRPTVGSPHPRLFLCGDLVRMPFPTALMERATTSGVMAANAALGAYGVAPEPLWSIPTRGVLASLQSWRRRIS